MKEETRQKLIECGLDYEGTMERLMNNETLLEKFLKKFPQDENYKKLKESLEQKDYETAFRSAHTLKGLAGNLGLVPIYDAAVNVVEKLRAENYDIGQDLQDLDEKYQRMVEVILEI